jgi:hypothetical protein
LNRSSGSRTSAASPSGLTRSPEISVCAVCQRLPCRVIALEIFQGYFSGKDFENTLLVTGGSLLSQCRSIESDTLTAEERSRDFNF